MCLANMIDRSLVTHDIQCLMPLKTCFMKSLWINRILPIVCSIVVFCDIFPSKCQANNSTKERVTFSNPRDIFKKSFLSFLLISCFTVGSYFYPGIYMFLIRIKLVTRRLSRVLNLYQTLHNQEIHFFVSTLYKFRFHRLLKYLDLHFYTTIGGYFHCY